MKKEFYSNGKLLITGEYLVLNGAQSLALPTKYGQYLHVENSENKLISWISYDADGSIWFETLLSFDSIINKDRFEETEDVKNTLIEILHEAYNLNSDFITNSNGYKITTQLTFPKFWGLGTSSTLINNIAQWLEIDAFVLLKNSFGGSGYDIACAQNNVALVYQLIDQKPIVTHVNFKPTFAKKIYFVYLNRKQNSKTAIASYYKKGVDFEKIIPIINKITQTILTADNSNTFSNELQKHEIEMSNVLKTQTVKESLFSDFGGVVKSLGAWGGDFVMVVSNDDPSNYFKKKGYPIVVPYCEMILH